MLRAQGIPFQQHGEPTEHRLLVPEEHAEAALRELRDYETENADWPPSDAPVESAGGGIEGGLVYVAFLIAVFLLDRKGALGGDWKALGALRADLLFQEPWRCFTALSLHSGPPHLISNLVFGSLFGFLVSMSLGGGIAWLVICIAGAAGNLLNGLIRSADSSSIGASTAVFAAVGILAGCEWRRRVLLRQRRIRRVAPFVMASLILGYLGMGGENTDVAAHATGLLSGFVGGVLCARIGRATIDSRSTQVTCGVVAVSLMCAAWIFPFA